MSQLAMSYSDLLEFFLTDALAGIVQVTIDTRQIEKVGDILLFVFVRQVIPKGMTRKIRLLVRKLIEILISARKHGGLQLIVQCGIPGLGGVLDIAVGKPLRKIQQGLVGGELPQIVPEKDVFDQDTGDAFTDLDSADSSSADAPRV